MGTLGPRESAISLPVNQQVAENWETLEGAATLHAIDGAPASCGSGVDDPG